MATPRAETLDYVERRFPGASLTPLAGDASTRNFYRFFTPRGESRVLMEYEGPFSSPTDDVVLSGLFRSAELPVAAVLEQSGSAGCLVLEDLGDRRLESALAEAGPSSETARELIERAVRLAVEVASRGTAALSASDRACGPALDVDRFRFEMDFFLEHFVIGYGGCASPPSDLRDELHRLAERAAHSPRRVLCHRDFHSRNLMVRSDGRIAMVDIQDARWGPDSYDLASLLRDAYIDLDDGRVDRFAELYRSALPEPPAADAFRRRFDLTSAQRMVKALGTFGYQLSVLGRERYSAAVPRTQARLRRLLPSRDETRPLHELLAGIDMLGAS